jgi:hypothetical protein
VLALVVRHLRETVRVMVGRCAETANANGKLHALLARHEARTRATFQRGSAWDKPATTWPTIDGGVDW